MNLFKFTVVFTLFYAGLLTAKELVVISHPFPPWQYSENGQVKGINIDLLSLVGERLDIQFSYKHQPWSRAWRSVKRADGDAVISSSRKEQREQYLLFPPIGTDLWTSHYVFFTHSHYQQNYSGSYQDILADKLKVCVVNGYSYDASFWQNFPYQGNEQLSERISYQPDNRNYHPLVVGANSTEECIGLLARHRVKVVLSDKSIGLYEINKLKSNEKMYLAAKGLVAYPKVLFNKGYSISFVKGSTYPELEAVSKEIWAQLRVIHESGEYQKIVRRWLD
ncbi:MAG: transporter substrate-binding domain-containing protein [Oceanospirillaceae bacterium]|nr:transporter substrate-binding domain-containing protein [Oceanospirillaceae bacterium]